MTVEDYWDITEANKIFFQDYTKDFPCDPAEWISRNIKMGVSSNEKFFR